MSPNPFIDLIPNSRWMHVVIVPHGGFLPFEQQKLYYYFYSCYHCFDGFDGEAQKPHIARNRKCNSFQLKKANGQNAKRMMVGWSMEANWKTTTKNFARNRIASCIHIYSFLTHSSNGRWHSIEHSSVPHYHSVLERHKRVVQCERNENVCTYLKIILDVSNYRFLIIYIYILLLCISIGIIVFIVIIIIGECIDIYHRLFYGKFWASLMMSNE